MPLLAALGSRALVLVVGVLGAAALPRAGGWEAFDPQGISSHLGAVGNLIGAPVVRWDSLWYLHIAAHGYDTAKSTAFFPLLPLMIRAGSGLLGAPALVGAIIAAVSFVMALLLLHRLTELELGRRCADGAVILLAFAPLSFFFSAVYTESLFLALSLGSVLAARRDRWLIAGILGGLAALTRVTGVLLLVMVLLPRAGEAAPAREKRPRPLRRGWMVLVPAGLGAYLLAVALAGWEPMSPFHAQSAYMRQLSGPVAGAWQAILAAGRGVAALAGGHQVPFEPGSLASPLVPPAQSIYLLIVLIVATAALAGTWRRLPRAYGIYALLALLITLSSPVAGQPLKSLDRYLLTIFPLWITAAAWLVERKALRCAVLVETVLLVLMSIVFATWTFVA